MKQESNESYEQEEQRFQDSGNGKRNFVTPKNQVINCKLRSVMQSFDRHQALDFPFQLLHGSHHEFLNSATRNASLGKLVARGCWHLQPRLGFTDNRVPPSAVRLRRGDSLELSRDLAVRRDDCWRLWNWVSHRCLRFSNALANCSRRIAGKDFWSHRFRCCADSRHISTPFWLDDSDE